ncbi:MAG TPA: DUF3179 domain-containing protein [Thermoanaerobaculia bacterium]
MRSALLLSLLLAAVSPDPHGLVDDLFSSDAAVRAKARDALIAKGDLTLAPALVDSVFFNTHGRVETVAVLEQLLGERHGTSWKPWIEAIGRREELTPAPGYIAFKAKLFAKLDPAFARFLREDAPRTIRAEEIVWGGVKKDGIPALDRPKMIERAPWLLDDDPVFGVVIDGDARAYPQRILAWHEMLNDVVGGRAVSLSYCTLCGAAILYDGRASDGRTYTFGSSGLLYRSNKLMYDRQTETLWSQLTGEPVFGALVKKKLAPLTVLPLTFTTWREWRAMHPKTRVLSLETGFVRDYSSGAAYSKYFSSPDLMFPVWKKAPAALANKEWVLVVPDGATRRIYPIDDLERLGVVHDGDLVLVGERVYRREGQRLRRDGADLVDESGQRFTITEEALVSSSTQLPRVAAHRAYWFGAAAFYPGAKVWQPE